MTQPTDMLHERIDALERHVQQRTWRLTWQMRMMVLLIFLLGLQAWMQKVYSDDLLSQNQALVKLIQDSNLILDHRMQAARQAPAACSPLEVSRPLY